MILILFKGIFAMSRVLILFFILFIDVMPFSIDKKVFISYDYSLYNVNKFSLWQYKNLLSPETNSAFIRFVPHLKFHNRFFEVNAEYDIKNYNSSTLQDEFRELNCKFEYSSLQILFGKTYTTFGTGYFYNPISVISRKKNIYDPDNKDLSQELIWLFKFEYFFEDFYFSFVKFKNKSWHNYALLGYLYFKGFDVYSLLFYTENKKIEYGCGFANTFGDALELHGEVIIKNDIDFYYHPIIFEENEKKVYTSEIEFFKEKRKNLKEFMLGFNYSIFGYSVIGEFYHRDFGIKEEEYLKLWKYFKYNYEADSDFSPMNCYSVLNFLKEVYLFKDYFFIRIAKNFSNFSFSLISVFNVDDASLIYLADIDIPFKNNFTIYIKPVFFNGKKKSEFKNSLYSHILNFGFRFLF